MWDGGLYMGLDARKPVFRVFDIVGFIPACPAAETRNFA